MAVKSSGTLGISDISAEFGGSGQRSLSQYYRGGGRVPSGVTAIPASGNISMSQFYGTSNVIAGSQAFTATGTWTCPSYTTLTVTCEGKQGSQGNTGATGVRGASGGSGGWTTAGLSDCGNGGPGGDGGPGGAGGIGGKAVKTWTVGTGGAPVPGQTYNIVVDPQDSGSVRFVSTTPVVANNGGKGGTGGTGGNGGPGGASVQDAYQDNQGFHYTCGAIGAKGSTGSTGAAGANGTATGGDTNTTGGSTVATGKVTLNWS